jgi:uncharacterized protein YcaQ
VHAALRAGGLASENEICYLRAGWQHDVRKALRKLLKEGIVAEVNLEGHEQLPLYVNSAAEDLLQEEYFINHKPTVWILSPFDNLLIQRKRLKRLFHFDYTIECYLPEHKRKFGYFMLPVLYNDQFIARFDPKADHASQTFLIRNFLFEENILITDEMLFVVAQKIKSFAKFNGCEKIKLEKCSNNTLKSSLKKWLK